MLLVIHDTHIAKTLLYCYTTCACESEYKFIVIHFKRISLSSYWLLAALKFRNFKPFLKADVLNFWMVPFIIFTLIHPIRFDIFLSRAVKIYNCFTFLSSWLAMYLSHITAMYYYYAFIICLYGFNHKPCQLLSLTSYIYCKISS